MALGNPPIGRSERPTCAWRVAADVIFCCAGRNECCVSRARLPQLTHISLPSLIRRDISKVSDVYCCDHFVVMA